LEADSFKSEHRLCEQSFTRNRKLDFSTLVLYLLNLRKSAAQVELDQFFKAIDYGRQALQKITKSAFFQARKQLSYTVFSALNEIIVKGFYEQFIAYRKWNGFRLCAIDGSKIRLPNEHDIVKAFGVHTGKAGQSDCPMGLASVMFDVLNRIVIDASLNHTKASERACAAKHLDHAGSDDLLLYDRGYNAFWLYVLHIKENLSFCMRARVNRGLEFKHFAESGERERVITLRPNKKSVEQCRQMGLSAQPIKLRLVRVDLPGEVEVLITNLMDDQRYGADQFKKLYHLRWGIEENYKRLKQWVEIENFSGKSALSVRQDFHAKIVAANLTSLMALAAQDEVKRNTNKHRRAYQVNFAQALSKMKHTLVHLIQSANQGVTQFLLQTIEYIALTFEAVRDGRSYPRRLSNLKNKKHFSAYKCAY
jgi:hypothetical protein